MFEYISSKNKSLLYPVSVSDFPCPGRGVLSISIGDITYKSAILFLTLLSARKQFTEDYWLFYSENLEGELSMLV